MDINKQVVVSDQTWVTLVGTFLRQIALIMTGLTTVMALVGKHDIMGLINYVSDSGLLTTMSVLVTTAVTAYGLLRGYWTKLKLIHVTKAVSDSVAVLKPGPGGTST